MKIIISSTDMNLKLYVPNFVLTSGVRLTKFINKYNKSNKEMKEVMNYIDMDFIIYAIKQLKAYKGLTLVEVKARDGTYVLIKV
ncbi:MAG: hypothetical protein E7212_10970 [Clostridium sartagoforme]|nr:hypothetical protein [Clostridium sartagoforme]